MTTTATTSTTDPVLQTLTRYRDAWRDLNAASLRSDRSEADKDRFFECERRWEKASKGLNVMTTMVVKGQLDVSIEAALVAIDFCNNDLDDRSITGGHDCAMALAEACLRRLAAQPKARTPADPRRDTVKAA